MLKTIQGILIICGLIVAVSAKAQTKGEWVATSAKLLAKSTTVLVEYSPAAGKNLSGHKYKLFDVAFGKVIFETTGRSHFGQGNYFIIIDDKNIAVYTVGVEKTTQVAKFPVAEISKTGFNDIEFVGLSQKNNPIFKLVGSENANYYLYNLASKTSRKLAVPADFHKSTYMAQSAEFVYLTQAGGKHACYSFNPEDNKITLKGTISSVPDEKIYRVQVASNGKHAIYGGKYVYDMEANKLLYQLPLATRILPGAIAPCNTAAKKVTADFSQKGDSIIIIKRLKENVNATEKIQIEIYDTRTNGLIKSFFFNYKGDTMADADVPSGWAAFVLNGKIKMVHLTSKNVVREFSLITPDLLPDQSMGQNTGTN